MALVLADRVQDTSTTTGTGSFTLSGSPPTGYQAFSVVGNGNTTYYAAYDTAGNWEVGVGTYSSTGPTLARTTILSSSNAGSAVNFPAGTKNIIVTYPSEKSVNLDGSGNVSALGTVSSGVWQGTAVGLGYGGTGLTTSSNGITTTDILFVVDGGGSAITTGIKGYLEVPFACTVNQWTLLADQSGSITVDILSDAYASYGTNTSMVGGGTKPAISAATKAQSAPASWTTTSISAGNIVGFNVTAATTVTRVTVGLKVTRT